MIRMKAPIYYVQIQAKRHENLMQQVPDDMEVCEEFLEGISKEEFIKGYKDLHGILKNYYKTARIKPESLNLPLYDIEKYRALGSEARDSHTALLWIPTLLYALGNGGELFGDKLKVDIKKFDECLKSHKSKHLPSQMKYLQDSGFTFTNWNGKNFINKSESCIVEYPKNKNVLIVLKAATRKAKKVEENPREPQKFDLYRITQYMHLFPTLFKDNTDTLEEYDDEYMISVLKKPYNEFLPEFISFMKEQGMTLRYDGTLAKNRFYDEKGKDTLNHIEYTDYRYGIDGEGKLVLRLKLNHPDQYMSYIEELPNEVKKTFKDVFCGHCTENCNRRIVYTIDGEKKESCGCFSFMFWNTDKKYMDYYKKLFLLEKEVREQNSVKKRKSKRLKSEDKKKSFR